VKSIYLKEIDLNFKSSHDHSKWAVSVNGKVNKTWICVGDINRAVSMHFLKFLQSLALTTSVNCMYNFFSNYT